MSKDKHELLKSEFMLQNDPTKKPNLSNLEGQVEGVSVKRVPEVVCFAHEHFQSPGFRVNIGYDYIGDYWNDEITSVIVVSGTWQFYEHEDRGGAASNPVGPGYYFNVETDPRFNLRNDSMSSFYIISWDPQ